MPSGQKRVFVTPLDSVDSTDKEGVGTIRFEGNKVYKYVLIQNTTATVAGAAGDPVAYFAETGFGLNRVVIDISDADTAPVGAGVLQGTVAGVLAVAYYGWIQTKGGATVLTAIADTPTDGGDLAMATTDKTLTRRKFSGSTPNIVQNGSIFGYAEDASAKTVMLDCPF